MDIIREWVRNLFLLILVLNFGQMLLPDSGIGKLVRYVFALIVTASVLYPLSYFI